MATYTPHNFRLQRVDYALKVKIANDGQDAVWRPNRGDLALGFRGIMGPVSRSSGANGYGEDQDAAAVLTTRRSYFDEAQKFDPHGTITIGGETFRVLNPVSVGKVYVKFTLGDVKA